MAGWTQKQKLALAILPKISSVLSLFGSLWIIVEVATEEEKIKKPYHRLLFAMSVYDVLESVWNFGSTWPIPEGSPDVMWASGNTATCTAQGFFLTLSVAVPIYNAMLSLYYVLVIKYNYTNKQLTGFAEPIMHIVAFLWAFGTALYSALAGLLNNANLWCWIAPLPSDCLPSLTHGTAKDGNPMPCLRGDNMVIYRFMFYFGPLWFCIFFATVCTFIMFRFVRARDKLSLKYRRPESTILSSPLSISHQKDTKQLAGNESAATVQQSMGRRALNCASKLAINKTTNSAISEESYEDTCDDIEVENIFVTTDVDDIANSSSAGSAAVNSNGFRLGSPVRRWQRRRTMYAEDMPRTVMVLHQAFFYLGTFYCTHIWSTSTRIVQAFSNGGTVFPLICLHSFFDPFQGFLNFLVYQRPRYLQMRKRYPADGRSGALCRMLRFSFQGDPEGWYNHQSRSSSFKTTSSR